MSALPTSDNQIRVQAAKAGITHFATAVAIFQDGKLLVVRRAPSDSFAGLYELPGGGVDTDESFDNGAIREALEETGLEITALLGQFTPVDFITTSGVRVRQFNYRAEVKPGPIKLDPREHDHYQWISKSEIDDLPITPDMSDSLHEAFEA